MEGTDRLLTAGALFGAVALFLLSHQTCRKKTSQETISLGNSITTKKGDGIDGRWNLQGKYVVVTGGTLGIGKAIVEECAALGAKVLTCGRKMENMTQCFNEWKEKGLKNIHGCIADVSTSEGRAQLLAHIDKVFGGDKVDVLVNNVGTNIRKRAIEYTEEEYNQIMQTNLHSAFHLTRQMYPYLRKKSEVDPLGTSSVVNVGSVAGGCNTAMRSGVVYAMTKAALAQMTYNLACEWAKESIRVNTIAPWYIETPLTKPFLANPEILNGVLQRTPMQRIGQPTEVSGLAAFLSMDHAAYITGQIVGVDGGFLRNGFY